MCTLVEPRNRKTVREARVYRVNLEVWRGLVKKYALNHWMKLAGKADWFQQLHLFAKGSETDLGKTHDLYTSVFDNDNNCRILQVNRRSSLEECLVGLAMPRDIQGVS